MTDVSTHYESFTFPVFKRPGIKVDVNTLNEQRVANSALEAVREIEDVAKVITSSSVNSLTSKDPASSFMTSRDVSAYQKAFQLGIIREIKRKRVMTDGKTLSGSREDINSLLASALVACPTCSVALRTNYQMEWVEDAGVFHCIRCGIDINPFDKREETLPEDTTNFGLSAIDDNKAPTTKPFLAASNRKFKKGGAFGNLEELKKKQKSINDLKSKGKKII